MEWLTSLVDFKVHGPLGAAVVAIVYFGWQHVKADRRSQGHLDERCRALEVDRVVKADWVRLDDKLDAIAQQNTETLRMLADRKV